MTDHAKADQSPKAPPDISPELGVPADQGASVERTRLAWRRTGLSATAVGLLTARPAFHPRAGAATWLITALAMMLWAVSVALAYRRARGLHVDRRTAADSPLGQFRHSPRLAQRSIAAFALGTVAFAVLGILVVIGRSSP